jgi:hypothetical protein
LTASSPQPVISRRIGVAGDDAVEDPGHLMPDSEVAATIAFRGSGSTRLGLDLMPDEPI